MLVSQTNTTEVFVTTEKVDITFYALELRRIAAGFQTGEKLNEVKHKVDRTLEAFKALLVSDAERQVQRWNELAEALGGYMKNTADPDWTTVMAYAKRKVNRSKQNAIYRRKRFKD